MTKALLLIDVQNDYFPDGAYPLWNTNQILDNILSVINLAQEQQIPIIHIQHVADEAAGIAPFFNKNTDGVKIHPKVLEAAPEAKVITKSYADSFEKTDLQKNLLNLGISHLFLAGMMTQNCVTHTALSKSANEYKVSVITDCCTTVDEMLHNIALHALSTRVHFTSHLNLE